MSNFQSERRYTLDVIPLNAVWRSSGSSPPRGEELDFWFHKTILTLPAQFRTDRLLGSRVRGNDRSGAVVKISSLVLLLAAFLLAFN